MPESKGATPVSNPDAPAHDGPGGPHGARDSGRSAGSDADLRIIGWTDSGPDVAARKLTGIDDIHRAIESGRPVWIDVQDPTPEQIERIGRFFAFHPLAIEDVEHNVQRPKLEEYEQHVFIVAFGVRREPTQADGSAWVPQEVDIFLSERTIVSFHEERIETIDRIHDRCGGGKLAFEEGPDRILYAILDGLIDGCFPLLDEIDERIESIERRLLSDPGNDLLEEIFMVRKDLLRLRRLLPGHREILGQLSFREGSRVSAPIRAYFRDVYDHVLRMTDTADTYRELLDTGVETYLSQTAERTNRVMKVLAIIATLGLPLTVVTGFFGMNFEYMPAIHSPWGLPIVIGVVLTVEGILLGLFRKKGWL